MASADPVLPFPWLLFRHHCAPGVLSARRTFGRQCSFPELLLSRYRKPPPAARVNGRTNSDVCAMAGCRQDSAGSGSGSGSVLDWEAAFGCHPVDLEGLEETAV